MGRKVGDCWAPLGGGSWAPFSHNVVMAEAFLRTKWHLDPSNRLVTIHERHRQTGQTGQTDNGTIAQGEPFYKRSPKTTSVGDGDTRSVGGGCGWLAGDTDELAGWPVTVGVVEVGVVDTRYRVSHPGADAER